MVYVFALGCNQHNEEGIIVEVVNKTNNIIKVANFRASGFNNDLVFNNIQINSTIAGFYNMSDSTVHADGSYQIEISNDLGEIQRVHGGYFTNGGPLDRKVRYTVYPDTIHTRFYDIFEFF